MVSEISIHTPAKGVTDAVPNKAAAYYDFNPHPREGGDPNSEWETTDYQISIHTPAKGVTNEINTAFGAWDISIHTPAKGVTLRHQPQMAMLAHFNPHPREGGD